MKRNGTYSQSSHFGGIKIVWQLWQSLPPETPIIRLSQKPIFGSVKQLGHLGFIFKVYI